MSKRKKNLKREERGGRSEKKGIPEGRERTSFYLCPRKLNE